MTALVFSLSGLSPHQRQALQCMIVNAFDFARQVYPNENGDLIVECRTTALESDVINLLAGLMSQHGTGATFTRVGHQI